jgi:phosphoribosyl-AMP cyclohydrolase
MSANLTPEVLALLKDPSLLIPAIAQDIHTSEVLMLAYMNAESLARTIETGRATYWSRSRNELWEKVQYLEIRKGLYQFQWTAMAMPFCSK